MTHRILAGFHVVLALLCVAGIALSNPRNSEPVAAFCGAVLFGGMAVAVWRRSRWVLLPGILLCLIFAASAMAFAMAILWPESTAMRLALACFLLVVVEIVSIVVAFNRRQVNEP
jgi:hypothetical protein